MNPTFYSTASSDAITIFLCGDVMTGRGIDQILPHPSDPMIFESFMRTANGYVDLAEEVNGPIIKPVDFTYIWGEAMNELERVAPDVRIINLETAVTTSNDYWKGKGINYRMHLDNIGCIAVARIDCCALANNHVLDWGYKGLRESLETLQRANLRYAGAGQDLHEAQMPAIAPVSGKGRVIVFSYGSETSGIPVNWAASADRPGVNLLPDLFGETVHRIRTQVDVVKQPGDVVVASIHWGSNWGYHIPPAQSGFAHALIDQARVDIIHGHSSHHAKGIELYNGKLILYGCGDFLNDYEGISGYEEFRGDLTLMYFARVAPANGQLLALHMTPLRMRNFELNRVTDAEARWFRDMSSTEGERLSTHVELHTDNTLALRW